MKDSLERGILGVARHYKIDSSFLTEIQQMLSYFETESYHEYSIYNQLTRIIEIIAASSNYSLERALISLITDCLAHKEEFDLSNKQTSSFDRTGFLTVSFLFDVLNHIAGYHCSQTGHEEIVSDRNRQQKTLFPHVCLVLENIDILFDSADKKCRNFVDFLLLTLFVIV